MARVRSDSLGSVARESGELGGPRRSYPRFVLPVVVVLCIAAPFVELAVLVWMLDSARAALGWPGDVLVVVAFVLLSALGVYLLRRESWAPLQRVREAIWRKSVPSQSQISDGMRVGGALLLALPGFLSGFLGLLLRIDPLRDLAASGAELLVSLRRSAAVRSVRRARTERERTFVPGRAVPAITGADVDEASQSALSGTPGPVRVPHRPDEVAEEGSADVDWEAASVAGSTVDRSERTEMEEIFFDEEDGEDDLWSMFAPEDDVAVEESQGGWGRRRRKREVRGQGGAGT